MPLSAARQAQARARHLSNQEVTYGCSNFWPLVIMLITVTAAFCILHHAPQVKRQHCGARLLKSEC